MANHRRLTRSERGYSFAAPSSRAGFRTIRLLRSQKKLCPTKFESPQVNGTWKFVMEELKPASQFQPSAFYMPDLPDVRKVDLDKIK